MGKIYGLFLVLVILPAIQVKGIDDRNIFQDHWIPVVYQVPENVTSKDFLETGVPDVVIKVDTAIELSKVLPTHFGVNTTFRNGSDQLERLHLYQESGMGSFRYPAGSGSNLFFWDGIIPNDFRITINGINGAKSSVMNPHVFADFKKGINNEATVVVNYFYARYGIAGSGTRAERVQQAANYAAGFVRRLNIELGAGVRYWEIGNECYGPWEEGYDVNGSIVTGKEYGEDLRVFAEAMKEVDPSIKIGAVVTREDDDWNSTLMPEVQDHADFLAVHNYFTSVKDATAANILNSVGQIQTIHTTLQDVVAKYTNKPRDHFPIAMTEFNSRGPYNCTMVNGLFVSQIIGEIIKNGYGMSNLWVSEWKWNEETQESKGFLALNDPAQDDYSPRQSYMVYHLYHKCFGDRMIKASSNVKDVKVYASTFESGEVGLVVINQSAIANKIKINPTELFGQGSEADIWWYEFNANSILPGDKKFYLNGETGVTPGGGPADFNAVLPFHTKLESQNLFQAKKYSVNFFVLKKSMSIAEPVVTNKGTLVTISTPEANAEIYYTTDGGVPDKKATLYKDSFNVPTGTEIKAISYKDGFYSDIVSHKNRYNVLFIAVDDLKPTLSCYGATQIKSPNIDRLAEKGVVFRNAYCQWSVCGPSRASLMSGITPDGTGIRNLSSLLRTENPSLVSLPEYFKNNGYETVACGKIFDPRNVDDGHDVRSWSIPYTDPGDYLYPSSYPPFVKGNVYRVCENTATEMGPEGIGDDAYQDGQICLDALAKLDQLSGNEVPFFIGVGFKKPHIPFVAPKKYWDLYNRNGLELAPFQKMASGSPEFAYFTPEPRGYVDIPDPWTFDDIDKGNGILPPDDQRRLLHGYYACVSYIDAQVGMLLDKLEEKGLIENTIVLLYGDHGYHLGDHNQWGKHTNFENAVRAPLIISAPGGVNAYVNNPVEFTDIYPTLCELSGLEVPINKIQGVSLAASLRGEALVGKDLAVSEYRAGGGSGYSFRTSRYRLSLWFKGSEIRPDVSDWDETQINEVELYDYELDPLETVNLAAQGEHSNIKAELMQKAKAWWNKQYVFLNSSTNSGLDFPFVENFEDYDSGSRFRGDFWFTETSIWERLWKGDYVTSFNSKVETGSGFEGSQSMKLQINTKDITNGGSTFKLRTIDLSAYGHQDFVLSYDAKTDVQGVGKAKFGGNNDPNSWHELSENFLHYTDTVRLSNNRLFLYFNNTLLLNGSNYNVWIDNLTISLSGAHSTLSGNHIYDKKPMFFPNPVKDQLYVLEGEIPRNVTLFGLDGKCIASYKTINESIDTRELPKGIYILSYTYKEKHKTQLLVK